MLMPQHDGFHDLLITALPQLRAHARALTRNSAAADDLVQDAVANALAARDSFTPSTNFRAWMHRILYNRFISDTRKRHATEDLDHVPDAVLGVGGAQEDRLILGELRSAIGRLPAEQRAALLLVALQGMSYDEIAEVTGCAAAAIKTRVFRARRQLRASLLGKVVAFSNASERCFGWTDRIGAAPIRAAD
ncbi:sigma-70 family RNA polymerase sigma factor [Dankookia rubra]